MLRTVDIALEPSSVQFKVVLPTSIATMIRATAKRDGMSSAEVIRRCIENQIQEPVRVRPFRPRKEGT